MHGGILNLFLTDLPGVIPRGGEDKPRILLGDVKCSPVRSQVHPHADDGPDAGAPCLVDCAVEVLQFAEVGVPVDGEEARIQSGITGMATSYPG